MRKPRVTAEEAVSERQCVVANVRISLQAFDKAVQTKVERLAGLRWQILGNLGFQMRARRMGAEYRRQGATCWILLLLAATSDC